MEIINISQNTLSNIKQNNQINLYIKKNNFIKAYSLLKEIISDKKQKTYKQRIIEKTKLYICNYIEKHGIISSKQFLEEFINNYIPELQPCIKEYYITQVKYYEMKENFCKALEKYNFLESDKLYNHLYSDFGQTNYENLKSEYIINFFKTEYDIDINQEQALAIGKTSKNVLLTARAGSGKTRTIAARAIYAIEKEHFTPEEVLILAFNKDAANEIKNRIINTFNYPKCNPELIRTFHSLAHRIVGNTDKELLYNDSNKYSSHKLTNFVESLYHKNGIWDEDFKNKLYSFYKTNDELAFDDEYWDFTTQNEKYTYLKHKTYYTLNGEKVKSYGEKIIANFLFEHNIKYKYENILTQKNRKLYKPDFTIFYNDKKYIWEHWGIDENDNLKQVPEEWTKSWDQYKEEMIWKRNLLQLKKQKNNIKDIIETSIVNSNQGEHSFECYIKQMLENIGIKCEKLSYYEILNKMEKAHKYDVMAEKFVQFIQAAKKAKISPNDIEIKRKTINISEQSKIFIELANKIYKKYDIQLKEENKTDFDNILEQAINIIHKTHGNCEIIIQDKKYKINQLKLIMIDEYQDFSRLFFELIKAIQKYNTDLKLFCVGDDWQAINGFAGSNLIYFTDFTKFFNNSEVSTLTYNYRSGEKIVSFGNDIMKGFGIPAKCYNKQINSQINLHFIDNIEWNPIDDKKYMYDNINTDFFGIHHRYFKLCFDIIKHNPNRSYIIMHRTSYINHYYDLNNFKNALENLLKINNIVADIEVNTIHKFKGMEADNIIILEFNSNYYPLIHPDNEFYYILGRTPQMVLDEERRLLYVALTRAKEKIFLLGEKNA